MDASNVQIRLTTLRQEISPQVELIAVSKKQPDERVEAALQAGQRVFGENYVQEAYERWEHRRVLYPDLKLHLIGPLQTNKAEAAVALFDCIHTVDRSKLVDALAKAMEKQKRYLPVFIQVNTGNESQKAGVLAADLPSLYSYAVAAGLGVVGLMCIPPEDEPAGLHFALLRTLADRLDVPGLSMGMSDDYKLAIRAGATHIRVGSALFGARDTLS